MTDFVSQDAGAAKGERAVTLRGYDLIRDPYLNKGTAFTPRERAELGLNGLLPDQHNSIETQAQRVHASIQAKHTALEKYIGLAALQDRNEYLFYRLLEDRLEELMPIVYTPTVGAATQNFSHVFRRGRGIWITPAFKGQIADILRRAVCGRDIRLIVVTDNESILGIGDQGAGGMAISIGKLALYVAGAGIDPAQTLPVSLDVGTNNEALLEDELYLGWRERRLTGTAYDELVDEFVQAVQEVFPDALVQWEDFRKDNALAILERYRDRLLSFNDDIQGTGAVALAGLLSATRVSGVPLAENRIVIYGAGAAGLGIARQLRAALRDEGLSGRELAERMAVLDSRGLLVDDREIPDSYKTELAWPADLAASAGLADRNARDLANVVEVYRPTVLIGSSGQPGAFSEDIVKALASRVGRPVILPFSNPTDRSEAKPEDLLRWTEGRALVATGSPFEPVEYAGKTIRVGQGNNVFIFPGLGLGALLCRASTITDGMINTASRALADSVTDDELRQGLLFPAVERLREVSATVAAQVVARAHAEDVAQSDFEPGDAGEIRRMMWEAQYDRYRPA